MNWIKGESPGDKKLYTQLGDKTDSPWRLDTLPHISSALSPRTDVTRAVRLIGNSDSSVCYQGQTHGHEGFLLPSREAQKLIGIDDRYAEVLFPYLIADDLLGERDQKPTRYVIDFHPRNVFQARAYRRLFALVEKQVLLDREKAAAEEVLRNKEALGAEPERSGQSAPCPFPKKVVAAFLST